MNVSENWGNERKFNPKLEKYELEDRDKELQMFYAEVLTKDGLEYELKSLKSKLAALNRHVKERDYNYLIIRDSEFYQSKLVLEGKVKHLRQQGKGKKIYFGRQKLSAIPIQEFFLRRCCEKQLSSKCLEAVYYSGDRPGK